MNLLGIGPLEFILVLVIVFLVLGPNDMAKTGRTIGRFISTVRKSEFWSGVTKVTREMRDLPNTLMREAELEDVAKELKQDVREVKSISKEFNQEQFKEIKEEIQTSIGLTEENSIAPPSDEEEAAAEIHTQEEGDA